MRLRGLWVLVGMLMAGAFALPAGANHEQITLQAVDSRIVLPGIDTGEVVPMRFTWSPEDTPFEGSNINICWNGHWDRSRLLEDPFPASACSSWAAGWHSAIMGGSADDHSHGHLDTTVAGHYETFIQRITPCEGTCYPPPPPHVNASNVVAVDVVDPCRLRLDSYQSTMRPDFPILAGAPIACDTQLESGQLKAEGEDGSKIAITAGGPISVDYFTMNDFTGKSIPHPVFRLRAGGKPADVTFTTGSQLGGLITSASTGAVHVLAVAPASVQLTFRNGVGRVHVRRGRVVALGVGPNEAALSIERYCGKRRPTIACLSKMRYRFFTMKHGASIKARVLRAGQSAKYRRGHGVIKYVG